MTSRISAPSKLRTTASSVSTAAFGADDSCALQSTICVSKTIARLAPPIPPTRTRPLRILITRPPRPPHCCPRPPPAHVPLSGELAAGVAAGAGYLGGSPLRWARHARPPPASRPPDPRRKQVLVGDGLGRLFAGPMANHRRRQRRRVRLGTGRGVGTHLGQGPTPCRHDLPQEGKNTCQQQNMQKSPDSHHSSCA